MEELVVGGVLLPRNNQSTPPGPVFESIGDGTSPSGEKESAASCKGGRERIWPPKSGVFLKDYKESEW